MENLAMREMRKRQYRLHSKNWNNVNGKEKLNHQRCAPERRYIGW